MNVKNYTILFHPIGKEKSIKIDFESNKIETGIYEELKIRGYQIYQFILEDFKFNMQESELRLEKIKFESLKREKKTWFGVSKKDVFDLLILPQKGFFYPYQYGHYFYLFTKHNVSKIEFEKWMDLNFTSYEDFDKIYLGENKNGIELLSDEDYLLITDHDYQKKIWCDWRLPYNQKINR